MTAGRASSFQNVFIISHCYGRHSPLLVGRNISVKHSAGMTAARFLIQIVSVLVVFICRLDTIAGGCVFDCVEEWENNLRFLLLSRLEAYGKLRFYSVFTPPRRDKDKERLNL